MYVVYDPMYAEIRNRQIPIAAYQTDVAMKVLGAEVRAEDLRVKELEEDSFVSNQEMTSARDNLLRARSQFNNEWDKIFLSIMTGLTSEALGFYHDECRKAQKVIKIESIWPSGERL